MVWSGSQPVGPLGTMTLMGGDNPHLGGGQADVGLEDGADLAKVAIGEDEAGVAATAHVTHLKIGTGEVRCSST